MKCTIGLCAGAASAALLLAGCDSGKRVAALDPALWEKSEWISAADAPVADEATVKSQRAADGTSWFVRELAFEGKVKSVKWMTTALGVYELYVNGRSVGNDALKPGFTHVGKTRRSFTYDVTGMLEEDVGAKNFFAAEVSAGWWRDKIVNFAGKKSAFRSVIEVTFDDGSVKVYGPDTADWQAGVGGPVRHAAIFDGEEYDARVEAPYFGSAAFKPAERNDEFHGEILPSEGGEVCRRGDKALRPVAAYVWQGVDGADPEKKVFGRVRKLRDVKIVADAEATFEDFTLAKGETLVVDFGQNCAGVPGFIFKAAEGTVLTCLPAEMLNDGNGERSRGNDGPAGSVYRENLRVPDRGMRVVYTFGAYKEKGDRSLGKGFVFYVPLHTFFGYRYASVTATDDVTISAMGSMPVTSITKDMEIGTIETGDESVNKLISNVYWGQLSNYLSVPTDCPQRNERLGWTADTQVFCEAGAFNADTRAFFHKWMRDMRDTQDAKGGFPGVAPFAQYGSGNYMRLGWADAGVIVPYKVWLMFGDKSIVDENWDAMERFLARIVETRYRTENMPECGNYQWNDWLSLTKLESCPYKPEYSAFGNNGPKADALVYWNYLGGCYWLWDARMMAEMAAATGRDASKYQKMAEDAKAYMRAEFFASADGLIVPALRGMQTPALFALKLGLVEGEAKAKTLDDLKASFAANGGTFHTGFLGTSLLMDTLTENGLDTLAYDLLLNHSFPGWLYSVDQGATTIWERWNSYTKDRGFGPVGMNSFNHYAYGAVLAWIYKTAAGIAPSVAGPGFRRIIMAPKPDRRLGHVKAEYKSAAGLVKSAWRYEGDKWIWEFSVPNGATALVTVPGGAAAKEYGPGTHRIEK
ncbi:MAG: family 78 glycoside hydrolase catalytic domain [Kiritimatiellae bacterium]|nr:family 78 glycoside hydrolase catalytic domain [Kiritimatiellia bacterium]